MEKYSECPVCNSSNISYSSSHNDRRKGLIGSWNIWSCESCELGFMNPMPNFEEIAKFYEIYSENEKFVVNTKKNFIKDSLRKFYHCLSGDVDPRDFISVEREDRILDYGCGEAHYLEGFHNKGCLISGAEIAEYIVEEYVKLGYEVMHIDDFNVIPFDDSKFDVIYMMQVFEHLRNPHLILSEIQRVSRENARLYIAVPNKNSFWKNIFKDNWVAGWFAPFHLFHYNYKSIKTLLSMHGFEISKAWTSTPELWFRFNLKAYLSPSNNRLDYYFVWYLDNVFARLIIMFTLNLTSIFVREKDCLILEIKIKNTDD
jgi:SAM-dependent methyltransferase